MSLMEENDATEEKKKKTKKKRRRKKKKKTTEATEELSKTADGNIIGEVTVNESNLDDFNNFIEINVEEESEVITSPKKKKKKKIRKNQAKNMK